MSSQPVTTIASSRSNRPTYSCVRCSDRKVRCDKQQPCAACIKHNVQCVFRAPPPPKRKQKRLKEDRLRDKVKHYEALLQNLGVDPTDPLNKLAASRAGDGGSMGTVTSPSEAAAQVPTPVSSVAEILSERSVTIPQIVHEGGKSKFVDNGLWSRVVEELHNPEDVIEDSSEGESDAADSEEDFQIVLGGTAKASSQYLHPPADQILELWDLYIENIDPLVKIVHVPTLRPAMQKAAADTTSVPRSFEALMFSIYAIAILSLREEECKRQFDESQDVLLLRYISATKMALARANFMGTVSIVVLQALILHIFTIRNKYSPRTVWTLTGVAIRIAEGMGLHRDGPSLGLPPFESEIRRRIWWQLKMHDFRAAELGGLAKFRTFTSDDSTCEMPSNYNDADLYPGMLVLPEPSKKPTDMLFITIRTEFVKFAKKQASQFTHISKDPSRWDDLATRSGQNYKDQMVADIEEVLEADYVRYLDPTNPIHMLSSVMARSSVNVIRFLIHHPRRWNHEQQVPDSEREEVWKISVGLLEQHDITLSDRRLRRFSWYFSYFLQWHAFIHILDTLRAQPLIQDAEKVWQLVESTYDNNPDMIWNTKKPIHVAVGSLCVKAYDAYQTALVQAGKRVKPELNCITNLRQQREAAQARRKARSATKASPVNGSAWHSQSSPENTMERSSGMSNDVGASYNVPGDKLEQFSALQMSDTNPMVDGDQFWLTGGLEGGLYGMSSDVMNVDTDFMLTQDYSMEEKTGQGGINWTQWDAWLSELNVADNRSNNSIAPAMSSGQAG